jgi:endonuclease/exonuclease/phosphatase family metal-dependent hydrolase
MKGRVYIGGSAGIAVAGIGALAAISLLVSCAGSNTDAAVELRVMSFNIRYGTADDGENSWSNRHQLVKNVIAEQSPDILGTQEALKFQLDELTRELDGYGLIGVGRDDGRQAGEHSAILYRSARLDEIESGTFWLSDTPEVPGSKSWGNQITRICSWALLTDRASGSRFYVYNVHLDHQSQAARERAVELIAARIGNRSSPDPVILTGDFNAGEDNPAMRYLRGEIERAHAASDGAAPSPHLRDTFRAVHPDSSNVGTFNAFRGDTSGEKIDAVLVSSEWGVSSAAIVRTSVDGRYPSDHFPVVATISLAGTARRE